MKGLAKLILMIEHGMARSGPGVYRLATRFDPFGVWRTGTALRW